MSSAPSDRRPRRHLNPRRGIQAVVIGIILIAMGFVSALWAMRDFSPALNLHELPSMQSCLADAAKRSPAAATETKALQDATELCWKQISYQGYLNDFQIRRMHFSQQYYSNPVLLWMVVIITFSGVVLAALQLAAAYELASTRGQEFAQAGTLTVERDKVVLQSSVTGLFILLISFAFFIVFVRYVYRVDETDPDHARKAAAAPVVQLPAGAVGVPPPAPSAPAKTAP